LQTVAARKTARRTPPARPAAKPARDRARPTRGTRAANKEATRARIVAAALDLPPPERE